MPSYMRFLLALSELVPMIIESYHFLSITPYFYFPVVMLPACLLLLIFCRTFPCHTPSFYRSFLFSRNFLFWSLLLFFFFSFTASVASSFLFFLICRYFYRNSFFFSFSPSPYLSRILIEFYLTVLRPNSDMEPVISFNLMSKTSVLSLSCSLSWFSSEP